VLRTFPQTTFAYHTRTFQPSDGERMLVTPLILSQYYLSQWS